MAAHDDRAGGGERFHGGAAGEKSRGLAWAPEDEPDCGTGGIQIGGGADVAKQWQKRAAEVRVPAAEVTQGVEGFVAGLDVVEPRRDPHGGVLQG